MPNSLDTDGGKAAVAFGIKKNGYSFYHSNGSWSNHGIRDVKKKIFHTQDREDIFSLLFRSGNRGKLMPTTEAAIFLIAEFIFAEFMKVLIIVAFRAFYVYKYSA